MGLLVDKRFTRDEKQNYINDVMYKGLLKSTDKSHFVNIDECKRFWNK